MAASAWPDSPYANAARDALAVRAGRHDINKRAKNLIVFVGDGMSPTFLSAARIYQGQLRGEEGEENFLTFEKFPDLALVKTYSANGQIPDSAATATALFTGYKADNGSVGVFAASGPNACAENAETPMNISEFASRTGKRTGVITTTSILDATPASTFGHAASRRWDTPSSMPEEARRSGCTDLAQQLVASSHRVAFGGGRKSFLPETVEGGARNDGADLTVKWREQPDAAYVDSTAGLNALEASSGRVLGLFATGDIPTDDPNAGAPTLSQMTRKAIEILSHDNDDGFILVVEHEGTDEFQHAGLLRKALDSALQLDAAVATALELVDLDETLVVVTADHGQGIAFAGWAEKGNPILGIAKFGETIMKAADDKPYAVLGFLAAPPANVRSAREDLTNVDTEAYDYIPQSAIPMRSVPHSGSDVALYAVGPGSENFTGLIDQTSVFYFIRHALGM